MTPDHVASTPNDALKTPTRNSIRGDILPQDLPSTQRKPDPKRRYGVRITDDEPSGVDASDSLDESEAELQRVRNDLSRSADTTGDVSATDADAAAVRQAISRRSAAGISLKDSEARIKRLEAENNELRIECDLLRHHMGPNEAQLQLVNTSNELIKLRRSHAEYVRLVKEQDSYVKESKRMWKKWGHLDPEQEMKKRGELEKKLSEALEVVERESSARQQAEEELEMVKNMSREEGQVARLEQLLQDQRDDHEEAMHALRNERDDLEDELQRFRDGSVPSGAQDELQKLRDDMEEMKHELASTEAENDELLGRIEDLKDEKIRLETDMEDLRAELQHVQAADEAHSRELEVAHRQLEHLAAEQEDGEQRVSMAQEDTAAKYDEQIDQLRDELAEANLELRNKEEEIAELNKQREDDEVRMQELESELEQAASAIEERNNDIVQLNEELDGLDVKLQTTEKELDENVTHIEDLRRVVAEREAEVAEANHDLQELSDKLEMTEEDVDSLKQHVDALEADKEDLTEQLEELRERSERRDQAYKERLGQAELIKAEIQSQLEAIERDFQNAAEDSRVLGRDVDSLQQERKDMQREQLALQRKLEEAYAKLDAAIDDLREEEQKRQGAEKELRRQLNAKEAEWRQLVQEKEETLIATEEKARSLRESLANSKNDIADLQDALRQKENESSRLDKSHSDGRRSLELEIERLKRDLDKHEKEVSHEKETQINRLQLEVRELSSRLATESQTVESQRTALNDTKHLNDELRAKMDEMEREAEMGERSLVHASAEGSKRVHERNELLLKVYEWVNKILSKSTAHKRGEGNVKPFNNFLAFQDRLLSLLRELNGVQNEFERKIKALEGRWMDKLAGLKQLQDSRLKVLGQLESKLNGKVEKSQSQWRANMALKNKELETFKSTNSELLQQISALRGQLSASSPGDQNKVNMLTTRLSVAEQRLSAAQTKSTKAQKLLEEAKSKHGRDEETWKQRMNELETRYKAAEERVKRERQGAKERVAELEKELQRMRSSLEGEKKRVKVLESIQTT